MVDISKVILDSIYVMVTSSVKSLMDSKVRGDREDHSTLLTCKVLFIYVNSHRENNCV